MKVRADGTVPSRGKLHIFCLASLARTCDSASLRRVWKGKISHRTRSSQKTKSVAESTAPSLRLTPSWHSSTRS